MPDQQQSASAAATAPTSSVHQQQNPPLLRRCSMSESHLDIVPHFFKEEKSFNPFNRMFSGLFDKGSTFSVNSTDSVDHFPSKSDRPEHPHQLAKGKSAIGMSSSPSASVAAGLITADGLRKSATSASALYNSNNNSSSFPSTAAHPFPTIHEDQGLTMSAGRDKVFSSMDQQTKLAKGIPPLQAASPPKSGFMNFFGTGGFLSRPVMHSPEENYRLIMALDR